MGTIHEEEVRTLAKQIFARCAAHEGVAVNEDSWDVDMMDSYCYNSAKRFCAFLDERQAADQKPVEASPELRVTTRDGDALTENAEDDRAP